jgi:hypothetical protein
MAETVTVACKLPHGLILQNYRMAEKPVPILGGGTRVEKMAEPVGAPITIRGVAHEVNKAPTVQIIGGYALTPGVDAGFFAAWLKANADHDAVRNGLIFAHAKADDAEAEAREKSSLRSGLEPIDPSRLPKAIETAAKAA